ncbi:galactose-binding domain-like protein [Aspergillus spectabilis]
MLINSWVKYALTLLPLSSLVVANKWNGKRLKTEKTSWGSLKAKISGPARFKVPLLQNWRAQDSLLERHPDYSDDDPAWVNAGDNETPSKYNDSTKPYLYSDQCGFHTGVHLWRGYFNGSPDGVYLEVQGGIAHGCDSAFTAWKVAGTAGGSSGATLDPVRTHYNEGGLRAERLGWHLPGFDDSDWPRGAPSDGFEGAGVKFYRTILPLNTPRGHDVALSVRLNFDTAQTSKEFRAYVYINGYQYGRYYPYVNEVINSFPAPSGIWNYDGDNVIGLAIWNQGEAEVKLDVEVNVDYVLESSLDVKFDGTYLRPGWDERRALYG